MVGVAMGALAIVRRETAEPDGQHAADVLVFHVAYGHAASAIQGLGGTGLLLAKTGIAALETACVKPLEALEIITA